MDKGAVQSPLDRTLVRLHLTARQRAAFPSGSPEWNNCQRRLDWLLDEYLRLSKGK